MSQSNLTVINVSMETFNEIANALDLQGKKINKDDPITLVKDIALKSPIDWRCLQVRKDVLMAVVPVYEPKVDQNSDYCLTDASHFLEFVDAAYNYVLKGTLPPKTDTKGPYEPPSPKNAKVTPIKPSPEKDKSGW